MSVVRHVVRRPVLGIVIFGLIAIVGLYLVPGIAIDMFPEINMPVLMVMSSYSNADPETVEKSITRVLEAQLVNLNGLKNMISASGEGSSTITLEFNYGTNLDARINDIRDRIGHAGRQLPDKAGSPSIMQFDPNSMPILRIAVKGNRSQNELRSIAVDTIQSRLEQVDGVASTDVMGGMEQLVRVEIAQNRLEAYGLTITGITGTLAAQNVEMGAGFIADGSKNYSVKTTGEYKTLADIAETVIAKRNGVDIRLLDIAEIGFGYPDETSTVYINGESGVYVGVTKQSGTNSVAVANGVYTKLKEIEKLLPQDISLEISQDNTAQIRDMINELVKSALLGGALSMAILFIFLRNIKSAVIIGISIPFSILVTLLVMNLAGITLNMLTMAGLVLGIGMIVDNSIVILENIFKYRERGAKPDIAAILGTGEVLSSIISSTLTTLCVFVPVFLFKNRLGIMGELFQGFVFTIGVSLSSSLFVAVFLVPILSSKYLPLNTRMQRPLKNRLFIALDNAIEGILNRIGSGYLILLSAAIKHRLAVVTLSVAALAGSVLCIPKMPIIMMPPMNEESVNLSVELPQGTKYEDTQALMLQLQEIAIAEIKGAKNIIVNAGSGGSSGDGTNRGKLSISLNMDDPEADTSNQVMNKLRAHFNDFPNASLRFEQGMAREMTGGSDIDLVLGIDDIDTGLKAAREIADILRAEMPELTEVSIDMTGGLPQVEILIDRKRAYNLGLSMSDIAGEISAAMSGTTPTTFRYNGNEYSVTLELRKEDREKLPDLRRIFVSSGTGNLIPLSNFATLEKGSGPVSISRENQSRTIHITGILAGGFRVDDAENKIKGILNGSFILPENMTLSYKGQWSEIKKTAETFALILTLSILLVFGVMAGQYESFKDPFINFCTIPLILIGVVGIYLVSGEAISAFTMVGLVMLVGIVVNNGIVLVNYTNLLVGRGVPVRQACIDGGESRLRPILMTTLTTILGLIPMAFFPGKSSMMIQPIGLTVIGGLSSSTFITLFFIPVMYSFINEHRGKQRNLKQSGMNK
jgi:HAE1 family hydrophobic/amphiphilic exporter-1